MLCVDLRDKRSCVYVTSYGLNNSKIEKYVKISRRQIKSSSLPSLFHITIVRIEYDMAQHANRILCTCVNDAALVAYLHLDSRAKNKIIVLNTDRLHQHTCSLLYVNKTKAQRQMITRHDLWTWLCACACVCECEREKNEFLIHLYKYTWVT